MINNDIKIEHRVTKLKFLARSKTFENQAFIDLDKDISEMNVKIKKYQSITNKNLFLEDKKRLKQSLKVSNKLNRVSTIKNKNKNFDCYSITTSSSYNDKTVKKVTFSTVEIIRVEKFKKYNAMNNFSKVYIQKNMEEVKNNKNNDESMCFIF